MRLWPPAGALILGLAATTLVAQPVGPEFRVNTYTTGEESGAGIAADGSGNFVVVWQADLEDGNGIGVFARRYAADGSPRGGEFRVNTHTLNDQTVPAVTADAVGDFVVTWTSAAQDGSQTGIFAQRYDSNGASLGGEFRVNGTTSGGQYHTKVVAAPSGDFIVVWAGQDGNGYGIFGQRFASSGSPVGGEFRANTYTTNDQGVPRLALDGAGNFVVAWQSASQDGDLNGVFAQRFASTGAPLGGEFRVNSTTSGAQGFPSVSSDSSGSFVVDWMSTVGDGSAYGIYAQRYASDGSPLGGEFRVNSYTTNPQVLGKVVSDDAGGFVVVWASQGQDASGYGIYAQTFSSTGAPTGAEFRVNATTSGVQVLPAATTVPGGDFVVAWTSPDANLDGIFARRFCRALAAASISLSGSADVCLGSSAGTATVTDTYGGTDSHQWGYRTSSGGGITSFATETGATYLLKAVDFPSAGSYLLVCTTTPTCGSAIVSNEIPVTVTADVTSPSVTPPPAATATQTLCQ